MEILKPKSIQCEYKSYTMRSILEKKLADYERKLVEEFIK